jgi:exodeoxyribonuclease-1
MTVDEIVKAWHFTKDPETLRLPVKTLKYNRCPALAPLGVIKDEAAQQRIGLPLATVTRHLKLLKKHQAAFADKVLKAVARLDAERAKTQTSLVDNPLTVDERLYEGFISDQDKQAMRVVRAAKPAELSDLGANFRDQRLKNLLPLYKARNYPSSLGDEERAAWEEFCQQQLFEGGSRSRLARYFARLEELEQGRLTANQQYLLEELKLYGQAIVPSDGYGDAAD